MFFVDKRHWPEFGIVTMFDKRHWPTLVLLQCFCGGAGPFVMFGKKYFVLHVTVLAVIFSVISFVFSLQMFVSGLGWRCIPISVKPGLGKLISILLKSKVDSTMKRYKKDILKFIEYCNFSGVRPVPPFPVAFIVAYLFKVHIPL